METGCKHCNSRNTRDTAFLHEVSGSTNPRDGLCLYVDSSCSWWRSAVQHLYSLCNNEIQQTEHKLKISSRLWHVSPQHMQTAIIYQDSHHSNADTFFTLLYPEELIESNNIRYAVSGCRSCLLVIQIMSHLQQFYINLLKLIHISDISYLSEKSCFISYPHMGLCFVEFNPFVLCNGA